LPQTLTKLETTRGEKTLLRALDMLRE